MLRERDRDAFSFFIDLPIFIHAHISLYRIYDTEGPRIDSFSIFRSNLVTRILIVRQKRKEHTRIIARDRVIAFIIRPSYLLVSEKFV